MNGCSNILDVPLDMVYRWTFISFAKFVSPRPRMDLLGGCFFFAGCTPLLALAKGGARDGVKSSLSNPFF
jgi:hypothetical protein